MENLEQPTNAAPTPMKPVITPPGELLNQSIEVYKTKFNLFAKIVGLMIMAYLPLIIISLVSGMDGIPAAFKIVLGFLGIIAMLVMVYLTVSAQIGILLAADQQNTDTFGVLFSRARKLFWPFLGISVLVGILLILWSILLIIPGIIFAVYYTLATYVLLYENQKGWAALKRSKELIRGYWWAVFGRGFFLGLIYWVFVVVISLPIFFVSKESTFYPVWDYFVNIVVMFVSPICVIYQYKIFHDLKKIKG